MNKTILKVVAVLGLVAAMPAQVRIGFSSHRGVQVSVGFGHDAGCRPVPRPRHGGWRTVCEQVWVPGCYRTEHVPAQYGYVYDACGRRTWTVVRPACTHKVWVPGHYETRQRRVRCD